MSTVKMNSCCVFTFSIRIKRQIELAKCATGLPFPPPLQLPKAYISILIREISLRFLLPKPCRNISPTLDRKSNSKSKWISIRILGISVSIDVQHKSDVEGWEGSRARRKRINRKSASRISSAPFEGNRLLYIIVIYLLVKVIFH